MPRNHLIFENLPILKLMILIIVVQDRSRNLAILCVFIIIEIMRKYETNNEGEDI